MHLYANAALSLKARQRMVVAVVEQGRSLTLAAEAAGVSDRTCAKWVARYRAQGSAGLRDRSSAPRRVHNRTDPQLVAVGSRVGITQITHVHLLGIHQKNFPCDSCSTKYISIGWRPISKSPIKAAKGEPPNVPNSSSYTFLNNALWSKSIAV